MNGKSKIWAVALLVGALLVGAVAGAAVDRTFIRESAATSTETRRGSDADRRGRYLNWLASELDLTEDQQAQVRASIELYREQASALWRDTRPRFEELKAQVRSEIRAVLTEEQAQRYDTLLERERGRHQREQPRRHGEAAPRNPSP